MPPITPPPIVTSAKPGRSPRGLIIILAVLLIAGLSVLGGFLFGKTSGQASSKQQISKLTEQVAELEKLTAVEPVAQTDTGEYLNIQEWNIRLPMEKGFDDLAYRLDQRTGTQLMVITSPTLAKIGTCPNYGGEIATLSRAKAGTVPTPTTTVTGFDGTIYMLTLAKLGCTSNPEKVETPFRDSVVKEFAELEAIPLAVTR